ncbi:hypothetical protein [Chitinimonas lacunae]|uniref:DUF4034 domain-containing protein n=1 Tax=Chitinimonas lacunae TaxID=1963018 RepID=A0ABV8MMH1_9NEIS
MLFYRNGFVEILLNRGFLVKIRVKYWAAALGASLLVSTASYGKEFETRRALSKEASNLFFKEEFEKLDALLNNHLASGERSPSGIWKASPLYGNADNSLYFRGEDPDEREWYWDNAREKIGRWTKKYPTSPNAHVYYAKTFVSQAWNIRGHNTADKVKEEDWKPFFENLEKARVYLLKHKSISDKNPDWFVTMLNVANFQQWPDKEYAKLLKEALDRHPLYHEIYFAAVRHLYPKWGGNPAAIEVFAQDAVRRTKDVEGYGMYARIYWVVWDEQYGYKVFKESYVDWPTWQHGIDDVLKKYPDQWNLVNFFKFSCFSGDKQKTQELRAKIHNPEQYYGSAISKDIFAECSQGKIPDMSKYKKK